MASIVPQIDIEVEAEFLASVLQGSKVVDKVLLESVEPEYFSIKSYKWIIELLKSREWKIFDKALLNQELFVIDDDEIKEQYRIQLEFLYDRELKFEEDAENKFKSFISYCKLNSSITDSFNKFNNADRIDLLIDNLSEGVQSAKKIIYNDDLKVYDFADDYENRQERRRNFRDNPDLNPRILTGIPGLDEQFFIKSPMIVDFKAPFKRYKSVILNAMGYAGMLQGFNGVIVVYENSYELSTDRFDSMFSGINYNRISNLLITQEEKDMLDRLFEWMKSWKNRLKIIKCVSRQTTVQQVEDRIKRWQDDEGFDPDFEVWDYLNIIASSKSYREERMEQAQVIWDMKGHADSFGVPIFTASQTNMDGLNAERLKAHHRGKSIDISQGLDISINIDQTEKEKEDGILVLSPEFARGFEITIPEIVLDIDIPRMQIDPCMYKLWEHAQRVNPFC